MGSGLGRHRTQDLQDNGVSSTPSWTAATAMSLWFVVVDLRCCQAPAMMRRLWLSDVRLNVRITAESQCIPDVESRGFKRLRRTQCDGGSRIAAVQNLRASRRVALVPQSPDGTPQSIHNLASGSVPESFVPSRTGHVRRRLVVVQSSRTPVVDMTACDTETDHDSDNSAPADAPPPRVWNEASVEESDTDSLELDGESDTVSLPGSVVPLEEEVVDSGPTNFTQHRREMMSAAFRELDACELRPLFECRAHVMKSVPFFLRGGFRAVLRVALEEISTGQERGDEQKQERGWKLFFLLPRMLLGRPCHGGLVPRKKLEAQVPWMFLIEDSMEVSSQAASARQHGKRRRQINNSQVARAENLAMIGELSAARQALESNGLAPGNRNTLNELRNRERRPPTARGPLPPEVACRVPERPF